MSYRASGLRAWIWQRVSAIVIFFLLLFFVINSALNQSITYDAWRHYLSQSLNKVIIGLFFSALLAHSWVGIRDIFIDYVHISWLRHLLIAILALWLLALGLWVLIILAAVH